MHVGAVGVEAGEHAFECGFHEAVVAYFFFIGVFFADGFDGVEEDFDLFVAVVLGVDLFCGFRGVFFCGFLCGLFLFNWFVLWLGGGVLFLGISWWWWWCGFFLLSEAIEGKEEGEDGW